MRRAMSLWCSRCRARASHLFAATAVVVLVLAAAGRAEDLTAQQIVDKALDHNAFGFDNAVAHITLTLVNKRGSERERRVEVRSVQNDGPGRTLIRFHSPADVAGTGFLVHENEDRDDDQYLYLPALGKVKRISGSQRNQRFMGTDLTYADLESRSLRKANLKRLADASISGNPVYTIEATPKTDDDTQYSRTMAWIHKTSFVPLKMEFFDKRSKLLKVLTVKKLEKKDGRWIAVDSLVKNVQKNTQTRMFVQDVIFGAKLSPADFTQGALVGG